MDRQLKRDRERIAKEEREEEKRQRKLKAEQERLRLAALKRAKVLFVHKPPGTLANAKTKLQSV